MPSGYKHLQIGLKDSKNRYEWPSSMPFINVRPQHNLNLQHVYLNHERTIRVHMSEFADPNAPKLACLEGLSPLNSTTLIATLEKSCECKCILRQNNNEHSGQAGSKSIELRVGEELLIGLQCHRQLIELHAHGCSRLPCRPEAEPELDRNLSRARDEVRSQ